MATVGRPGVRARLVPAFLLLTRQPSAATSSRGVQSTYFGKLRAVLFALRGSPRTPPRLTTVCRGLDAHLRASYWRRPIFPRYSHADQVPTSHGHDAAV